MVGVAFFNDGKCHFIFTTQVTYLSCYLELTQVRFIYLFIIQVYVFNIFFQGYHIFFNFYCILIIIIIFFIMQLK